MTSHQEEALWASIEHWLENWQDPDQANPMGDTCPCCEAFYDAHGCKRCPIYQHTGESDCDGTPWDQARNTWRKYLTASDPKNRPSREEVQASFEREYRFLVELALGELK